MATQTPTPGSLISSKVVPRGNSQVRVVVRVRPFIQSELESDHKLIPCVSVVDGSSDRLPDEEITVHIKDQWSSRSECFKLDSFFGQDNPLETIFNGEVSNLISGVLQGLNATVFAYGATGSGKTYTMQGTDCQPGLIPLSMSNILSQCRGDSSCSIEIAFYEIYLDRCYDLLEPKAKEIMVLEDKDGQVHMKGLSKVAVRSMEEFAQIFSSGVQRRKIAHTGLNDASSRSHAVVSITVCRGGVAGKLNLIDLAGNEDNRKTGNDGVRLLESAKINQSLFVLSNVIYALNNNEQRIPYRESKLTRILQDSLGGTSLALMIACLNPASYHEAVHTVSLAARSRHVSNYVGQDFKTETPKVKIDMEAKLRAWLESKSKTKNSGLFSPVSARTPAHLSAKKPASARAASRVMVKDEVFVKGRKLFDCAAPVLPSQERCSSSCASSMPGGPSRRNDAVFLEKSNWEDEVNPRNEIISEFRNLNLQSNPSLPEASSNEENEGDKETSSCNLPSNREFEEPPSDSVGTACAGLPSDLSAEKENAGKFEKSAGEMVSPARRVFSPVECNRPTVLPFEPKTPKTSYEGGTPLHRFTVLSSKLKDSLVQEYLEFLNTASREELLALKGIGQKRADYIIELREETPQPLKTLNDLEKIGLSTKQVHNIFKGTARRIFG
ncbi:ATP binding microtubule motor family protein [Wolffia australiana]